MTGFAAQTRALLLDLARDGAKPEDAGRIEEALARLGALVEHEESFDDITATAFAIASLDFEKRAAILNDGSASDGLAAAINMLSEELAGYVEDQRASQERMGEIEDQLRQARKMESIGRLTGGIAHDFNNLLSVILTYSNLMLDDLSPNHPMYGDLVDIRTAGERAAELTHQLLAFSRQQLLELKVIGLDTLVEGLARMMGRIVGEDIAVHLVLPPDLALVNVDPGQIEQVIVNLVVNARDAMPTGGDLTIETGNVELDEDYCAQHPGVEPGRYVLLAVSDTGVGMDRATQARIFEPFFTTKEVGRGTGLGLSTVFGIVHQCRGSIYVYSEPGRGTTFKIYLPESTSSGALPVFSPPPSPLHGSETVLLVEDDDGVREVVQAVLRRSGYRVLVANGPDEAIHICETEGAIDLLLTDVVMPKTSGRELAERLAPTRPFMRVLYMSGYTADAVVRHGVLGATIAFLQKPITPTTLLRKVRQVLDSPLAGGC